MSAPEVSVIVPARDEAAALPRLVGEIVAALADVRLEIIVVDDGSTDGTGAVLGDLVAATPALRLVAHDRPAGQSAAVRSGLAVARAPFVVTIDGDGQNDPADIPRLLAALAAGGPRLGLVAGERRTRRTSAAKRLASRLANGIRRGLLGDGSRDTGCGLKALRAPVFRALPYFDGWHRFLPALVLAEGYEIRTLQVADRPRNGGRSKTGILDRAAVTALDLFGVWWLVRRRRRRPIATLRHGPDDGGERR